MATDFIKSHFSAAAARKAAGVSQRQLDYWDQVGLVCASARRARGKGVERKYTYSDLVKLAVVKQLRDAGLSLQKIRKAVRLLRKRASSADPLADEVLITDGVRLHRRTSDENALEDVLNSGQLSFSVVHLGRVEAKVRRIISLRLVQKAVG